MDNVPYEEWSSYLHGLLLEHGIEEGIVLDLGCGTGAMTERLAAFGYDMIGVDNSEDMLELAMEKRVQSGQDILYLLQDMREFELYGTVKAVVSICDSINYILEEDDLREVFSLVNNYLDPKGMFIFDLNTKYKYEQMGETTIAENREEGSFIWENYFDENISLIGTGKHELFTNLHEFLESFKFDVKRRGKIRLEVRNLHQEEERLDDDHVLAHGTVDFTGLFKDGSICFKMETRFTIIYKWS